jgi:DNA repair protein RecO (recombination protein O)
VKETPLQRAFIIHHRPYRNNSVLLDFFTEQEGRVTAVARGVKLKKKSAPALLQPFHALWVSFVGRGEVRTVAQLESAGLCADWLSGEALFAGFYVNELIYRLFEPFEAVPELFSQYGYTIQQLLNPPYLAALRYFEKKCLEVLGFALPLSFDAEKMTPIDPEKYYRYEPASGFFEHDSGYCGAELIALDNNCLETPQELNSARRLLQLAISEQCGMTTMRSRELFAAYKGIERKK